MAKKAHDDTANAHPTKKLFIDTLTRDIGIRAAILDLIDNSVDGAKRLRPRNNFRGLRVAITANSDKFVIDDNCGGISIQMAKEYAFRFGRPSDYKGAINGSVGYFGVGMKRTLFKIAKRFKIKSVTKNSSFEVKLDVDNWKQDDEDWTFPLTNVIENTLQKTGKIGTVIEIDDLRAETRTEFSDTNSIGKLREEIREAYELALGHELNITFNGTRLTKEVLYLSWSKQIQPTVKNLRVPAEGKRVTMRLLAGIDTDDQKLCGWYVYCNGRAVLRAETSRLTGWGTANIPKYHQQFARFRGYAFLEADDAGLLPWNTTKTGLSEDSSVYQRFVDEAVQMMRPIVDFLNDIRKEESYLKTRRIAETPLMDALADTKRITVEDAEEHGFKREFKRPPLTANPKPDKVRIRYVVDEKDFARVSRKLETTDVEKIGLKTFVYFKKLECGE